MIEEDKEVNNLDKLVCLYSQVIYNVATFIDFHEK